MLYRIISLLELIGLVASSSHVSKSYFLHSQSHLSTHQPRQYLSYKPPKLIKRGPTRILHKETASFSIYLSCNEIGTSDCDKVLDHLVRASKRIENVLLIRNQIRFNATFYPFCSNEPVSCNPLGTLGYASPSGLHVFNQNADLPPGIDSNYAYPASLIRQILPANDSAVNNNDPDIVASFNSNINWWFSEDIGLANNGEFGPASLSVNATLKSYDFEQVALHEVLHGLGFISGWSSWRGDENFYPSFFEYDNNGKLLGLGPPWIYDKYMSDAINGFWMRDYDLIIRRDISKSIEMDDRHWDDLFLNTTGYKIALALASPGSPLVTPRGLWNWFPDFENNQLLSRYAILNTPLKYSSGSSISHLDDKYYSGTSQYLMKPTATKNVGLDGHIPYNRLGPISESVLGILRTMGYITVL